MIVIAALPSVGPSLPIIPLLVLLAGILSLAVGFLKDIRLRSFILKTEDWERAMFICAGILYLLYSVKLYLEQ